MNWTAKILNNKKKSAKFPLIYKAPAARKNVTLNRFMNANFVLIFMYERNLFQI